MNCRKPFFRGRNPCRLIFTASGIGTVYWGIISFFAQKDARREQHRMLFIPIRGKATLARYIPPPSEKVSVKRPWRIRDPGGTLRVSQTLPPMTDPLPMVTRPRMEALE